MSRAEKGSVGSQRGRAALAQLLAIARRIGSTPLRLSVQRDLINLDPEKYRKRVKVKAEA